MQPIFFTLRPTLSLIIIPDTQAYLNGHIIITRTYHIHKKNEAVPRESYGNLERLEINHNNEPSYMGYLTFDVPGKVYSYTSDGDLSLSPDQIEQLIEFLNEVRENPQCGRNKIFKLYKKKRAFKVYIFFKPIVSHFNRNSATILLTLTR